MKILISACLLGFPCRYDGRALEKVNLDGFELYPVCPEVLGGLSTPRPPSERKGRKIVNIKDEDVSESFRLGAKAALEIMKKQNIQVAFLKENSPSCGVDLIYDGSFSGNKVKGKGVFTELLLEKGYRVYSENQIETLKEEMDENNYKKKKEENKSRP